MTFSSLWFTSNALTELDKTLTLRLAGSVTAGIYAAAYRMASVLTLPVVALAGAVQPRLFRHAREASARAGSSLVWRLVIFAAGYGILASIALLILSNLLPVLLGTAFSLSAGSARWLVLAPLFFSLRLMGSTVLMTTGRQSTRILVESFGIAILIGLCFAFIPSWGLRGSAIAVTATEGILAICIWTILWKAHSIVHVHEAT